MGSFLPIPAPLPPSFRNNHLITTGIHPILKTFTWGLFFSFHFLTWILVWLSSFWQAKGLLDVLKEDKSLSMIGDWAKGGEQYFFSYFTTDPGSQNYLEFVKWYHDSLLGVENFIHLGSKFHSFQERGAETFRNVLYLRFPKRAYTQIFFLVKILK